MKKLIYTVILLVLLSIVYQMPAQAQNVSEKKISNNWKKNRKSDSLHKTANKQKDTARHSQPIPKKQTL